MPRTETVYSIFLATPSDVTEEHDIVREALSDWNLFNSRQLGVRLALVTWRNTAYPTVGKRSQQAINEQALDETDIVIGIFWTRFGSPTGVAESGTEEEIRRGIAAGKRVMLYFSDRPAPPSKTNAAEREKIDRFKKELGDDSLYWSYDDAVQFKSDFRRHVSAVMKELLSTPAPKTKRPRPRK